MKFNSLKTKILQIFQYNICSFSLSQNSILKLLKAKPMILMAFLSLISIFPNSVFAQEGGCGTLPSFPILEPGALPIQCGFSNDILNNIDKLPYHIVKVNIHWIQNKNGENFEPNNPDEKFDGNKAAKNLLLWANYDLRDFGQHPNPLYPASQSFLHDSLLNMNFIQTQVILMINMVEYGIGIKILIIKILIATLTKMMLLI